MIRHYAEPEGRVIFDHRHNAAYRVASWAPQDLGDAVWRVGSRERCRAAEDRELTAEGRLCK
jgi:hypothetical protein